jgi:hypothetical protein
MIRATVVLWRGYFRESVSATFDSRDLAHVWVYEQRRAHGRAFVQGFVV